MPHGRHDLRQLWKSKGFSGLALSILVHSWCKDENEVRALGPAGLLKLPNCGWETLRKIGLALGEDWSRGSITGWREWETTLRKVPTEMLVRELKARETRS